jgi:hypothetical protein
MVYIDEVHYSKAYGAINHFEKTRYRPILEGTIKKRHPYPPISLKINRFGLTMT